MQCNKLGNGGLLPATCASGTANQPRPCTCWHGQLLRISVVSILNCCAACRQHDAPLATQCNKTAQPAELHTVIALHGVPALPTQPTLRRPHMAWGSNQHTTPSHGTTAVRTPAPPKPSRPRVHLKCGQAKARLHHVRQPSLALRAHMMHGRQAVHHTPPSSMQTQLVLEAHLHRRCQPLLSLGKGIRGRQAQRNNSLQMQSH